MSNIKNAIKSIANTLPGQERNMYPDVLALFKAMGHNRSNIKIDTASETALGIPDLIVQVKTDMFLMSEWLVCEVKDERDAFSSPAKREKIFSEKAKYISIDTAFFVMIDPSCLVMRPVILRSQKEFDSSKDIVVYWKDALNNGDDWFLQQTTPIHEKNSGYSKSLDEFRSGNNEFIAFIDLNTNESSVPSHTKKRLEYVRKDFYESIRKSTEILQSACLDALNQLQPEIKKFEEKLKKFEEDFGGYELTVEPFSLHGSRIYAENSISHDIAVNEFKKNYSLNPSIAKLSLSWLPDFKKRVGKVEFNKKDLTYELFATETANLILARVLLLRFFEDHGFFGEKRYICNGGVKAFQNMREYFDLSYTKLLRDVYEKAKPIYLNVFNEMELDWIFGSSNERLSKAIELSLMYLSRFNFQTVKGDVLTGIYDRFMSGSKRKQMGEYFTPPDVARYVIERLNIKSDHKVFDPSCGSGTFPIEVFETTAGKIISNGFGDYSLAQTALSNIAANDLNPFSAMLTQIQLIWHILPLRDELKTKGFPSLRVSEKHNSLIPSENNGLLFDSSQTLFSKINQDQYDFVLGNPPYVRPERSDQELTKEQAKYYSEIGVDKNLFTLFIYRALQTWCKPSGDGSLAFVIPLSFCDNNSNRKLRELFMVGARWRIREIVDMEAISDKVFDASVNPIILIADTKVASKDDSVCIRVAGMECISSLEHIDLSKAKESSFDYESIWSEDGRILTKIANDRLAIINKIKAHQCFSDVTYKFWQRKEGAKVVEWQEDEPDDFTTGNWDTRDCISGGAAFRNVKPTIDNGFDVFKGENISACLIEGNPQETNIDIKNVNDPSLWKYLDVMPDNVFAFLQISIGLNAVKFNMKQKAFLNTASIFIPDRQHQDFPFDVVVLSNVYQFYYALYLRMGIVEEFWSHLYPTNLKMLPWSESLMDYQDKLEALRQPFLDASRAIFNRADTLNNKLLELEHISFQDYARNLINNGVKSKVEWNGLEGNEKRLIHLMSDTPQDMGDGQYQILLSNDLFSWVSISDHGLAERLIAALKIYEETLLERSDILSMKIPETDESLIEFNNFANSYDEASALGKLDEILSEIDRMVAESFGLSDDELLFIQDEMKNDSFLKNIKPSLPYTGKRKRGLLKGLDASSRYD